ncbi:hypothetical protein CVIRNUC_009835 [Coccomyxa viridis]|uniref:Nuclear speckle splicing regulatory protein 1 N-terminal domain-containing protein n=1 Tax=Coccomyxa viridis TaxID=1274662 RepID=A0AAV1IIZ5_9CHLO|nr:hypothetical protein CVIRNUC_009835 [Coccomyxa viridis]
MHMQIGTKGIKYGLQLPKQKVQPAQQPKKLSAFGGDDGSDDEAAPSIGNQIARQAAKKQNDKKVAQLHAAALAEDASVFAYDEVYDSLKESEKPKREEKKERKSKYIEGLLDKAKERNKEQDIIYERGLLKERQAEDHLFGDKDKFVTAAYKKKLEEDQMWLAEEKIREARDAKHDVIKAGHMGNFYRNIMSNNTAFGTAAPPKRLVGADAPSSAGKKEGSSVPVDPEWEAARRAREAYEAAKELAASDEKSPAPTAAAASNASSERPFQEASQPAAERQPDKRTDSAAAPQASAVPVGAAAEAEGNAKEETEMPADIKEPVLSKEEKAAAAKERFLARKRKAPA